MSSLRFLRFRPQRILTLTPTSTLNTTARRSYADIPRIDPAKPSSGTHRKSTHKPKEYPSIKGFLAIGVAGFGAFTLLLHLQSAENEKLRAEKEKLKRKPKPVGMTAGPQAFATAQPIPKEKEEEEALTSTFDPEHVTVIFVLGGPGAGKGTQCANLVRDYGFKHLSAGDLLRAEQEREGSQYGELIRTHIKEGKIVPMEVTIKLLEKAMGEAVVRGSTRFLIDGFPRKMDQAVAFEKSVCPSKFTLFFTCSESTMLGRLLHRGETSGRDDDNAESIKKRFRTFVETSMPVVEYFEGKGKVLKVSCEDSIEAVYGQVRSRVEEGLKKRGAPIAK
ncbi:bifunctional uridylate/adenylate kinase [Saitoella coloradoensis]